MDIYRIELEENKLYERAKEYFVKSCGFDLTRAKHQRMMEKALEVREKGLSGIRPFAMIACCGPDIYRNGKINCGDIVLGCPAFEQIGNDNIQGIYFYVLTSGGCKNKAGAGIVEQLYADIWGTSYVDAARDELEEKLREKVREEYPDKFEKSLFLSDAMGPGFYGMAMEETKGIFRILDIADKAPQLAVKESGLMLPVKTCAGLYFLVKDKIGLPRPDCRDCIGNPGGCEFCRVNKKLKEIQVMKGAEEA